MNKQVRQYINLYDRADGRVLLLICSSDADPQEDLINNSYWEHCFAILDRKFAKKLADSLEIAATERWGTDWNKEECDRF